MPRELGLWQFVADHLERDRPVILLVVTESSGSSPGRAGYKMAVGADGELCGSIGGGIMEVSLVKQARAFLSVPPAVAGGLSPAVREQVHRKNLPNSSGMICSGKQTVVFKQLTLDDLPAVRSAVDALTSGRRDELLISNNAFTVGPSKGGTQSSFEWSSEG